jgi:flagellar biosynthetic protein FlhB
MADGKEEDPSQKTEEATSHKLEEARKKGQVPLSKELSHFFALIAATIFVSLLAPYIVQRLIVRLRPFFDKSMDHLTDGTSLIHVVFGTLWEVFLLFSVPLLLFAAAGVLAGGLQTKFAISTEKIAPKLSHISILSGIKRLFSLKALMEFTKSLLKLAVVGSITLLIIWPEISRLDVMASIGVIDIYHEVRDVVTQLFIAVVCALLVLAAMDFIFQKFQFAKDMKMTKEEVKEEHKKLEGDPQIRSKRRRKQKEMSAQRSSISEIPHATVLITNPTHFAVGLKWDDATMEAPQVIAKGQDLIAVRMRQMARDHDIPILENPPLARALFSNLEIDDLILPEHFLAVAEVIRYVKGVDHHYLAREEVKGEG